MKSSRVLLTIVALVTPAAPIWAQAEILQVIPDDAIGFAVINRVGQTNEKLISLGKRLKAEMQDSPLEKLRSALGGAKGLAENGMGAVAAFEGKGENDKPRPLLYVPVTDYKTFLEPLEPGETKDGITAIKLKMIEKEMFAGKRGNYAVIAHPEDRALLERALKATKTLTTAAEPLAGWLADNDAAGVLTTRGIKLVGAKIRQGLDDGKQQLAILPQEAQQTLVKFLEAAENFFKSAETDVSHAGLAVRLDDKGNLHLNARAQFVSGSGFAKAGGGVKALAGGPVAGLPAGPFVFAMGGALPRDAVKAMSAMNLDIMKAAGQNIPEESLKKLEAVNAQMMEGMKGGAMVWQVGKENQPLFANFVVVTHTENSTAFLSSYEKALTVTNDIMKGLNLPITPTYDVKKVKLGAKDALETSMDFSNLGLPQEVQQIFEKVFGEGGKMTMSIAARDDKTVVLRYTNTAGLKEVLEGGSQLTSDPDVAQVTKALPAGSQWALYLSPKGTFDFADRTVKAVVPLPLNIPKFPATPPVAVGIRVSAQNFEVHTVIPAAVIDNVADLVQQLKGLFPGGA